jgi:outer membrane biosynthesis protein TonB
MLLAMGGLLYWKFGGKDEPPPAPPPKPSAAAAPVFEEPPPPPPPPEPEEEKKDTPTSKKRVASGPNPCGAACKGDAPAALRAALGAAAGSAKKCYERALLQNSTLQGRMVVAVKVGPSGSPCGASIASDTLGDPSVTNCVLQKFRAGTFPAPVGGCVDVQVPISFMPKTGGP